MIAGDGSVTGMKVEVDGMIALFETTSVKVAGNYLLIDSYLLRPFRLDTS